MTEHNKDYGLPNNKPEGLFSISLKRFFSEMSDPSVETLEKVATDVMSHPGDNLHYLLNRLSTATFESFLSESLVAKGVAEKEAKTLEEGVVNTEELVHHILLRSDFDTGKPYEDLTPRTAAETVFEKVQVRKSENELEKATDSIRNEPDFSKRSRLAKRLKKRTLGFIERFDVTFPSKYEGGGETEPVWTNLVDSFSWHPQINLKGSTITSSTLAEAILASYAATKRFSFEKRLCRLPSIDKDELERLRLRYGAKAANLIILASLVGSINKMRDRDLYTQSVIPEFMAVPADLYVAWKGNRNVDEELLPYFEWANTLRAGDEWANESEDSADYIVRSSAVLSEDAEHSTGAGVYDSVKVPSGSTFQEFKNAVIKVYESTDSEKALAYRHQFGIPTEQMGLVIQKLVVSVPPVYSTNRSCIGYVNSKLPGISSLMEIVTGTSRNLVKRVELDFFLALDYVSHKDPFRGVHQFKPDSFKVDGNMIVGAAQLALIVEKLWGKEVQIEFVASGFEINVVQVRPLPDSAIDSTEEIHFPDLRANHSGAAIGVGDMVLEILGEDDNNKHKVGAVIIPSTHMWSFEGNPDSLPMKGAVIIASSEGERGHIQTLCAEAGLICIYPDLSDSEKPHLRYDELLSLNKIRVVSNGIEGRVYKIEDDSHE